MFRSTHFPAPDVLGSIQPADLTNFMDWYTTKGGVRYYESRDDRSRDRVIVDNVYENSEQITDLRQALLPFLAIAGAWLQAECSLLYVSVSDGVIDSGTSQRGSAWHQDSASVSFRSVVVASSLPTEFAVGTLPRDLGKRYRKASFGARKDLRRIVPEAVERGALAIEAAGQPYDVIAFDARHVHRSVSNPGAPVHRSFLRITRL